VSTDSGHPVNVASGERGNTSDSPGANPEQTTGLEPGGGVPPGETPPAADQMSGASGDSRRGDAPNMGPVAGNRTPMIITLSILAVIVIMVAILIGASALPS
jgi:hypothetical protein